MIFCQVADKAVYLRSDIIIFYLIAHYSEFTIALLLAEPVLIGYQGNLTEHFSFRNQLLPI